MANSRKPTKRIYSSPKEKGLRGSKRETDAEEKYGRTSLYNQITKIPELRIEIIEENASHLEKYRSLKSDWTQSVLGRFNIFWNM